MLAPGGVLLLAIENRFGLKYWCGAAEDHTGVPFDGIGGYEMSGKTGCYQGGKVRTFGKRQLEYMLGKAGLIHRRFYYPLPDYKFPTLVVGEGYPLAPLDVKPVKYSYPQESELVADERRLLPEVIENGVFPFFANSFFVECSTDNLPDNPVVLASMKRDFQKEYRLITTIDSQGEVIKRSAYPEAQRHLEIAANHLTELSRQGISVISHNWNGQALAAEKVEMLRADVVFLRALMREDIQKAKDLLSQLASEIQKSSIESDYNDIQSAFPNEAEGLNFGQVLKQGYIDMTFENCFYHQGQLIFFDQEWCCENIPLSFILCRAIRYGAHHAVFSDMQDELYQYIGVSSKIKELYEKYESQMVDGKMDKNKLNIFDPQMYGEHLQWRPGERQLRTEVNNQRGHIQQLLESERELSATVAQLTAELNGMRSLKSSYMWRIASGLSRILRKLHLKRK